MGYSIYIRLWGVLDIVYVLWNMLNDLEESKIPFIGSLSESLDSAAGFGQPLISILTYVAVILTLSIIFSGPLMLALIKVGVYISLVQFPFRLMLIMPPTFFFIQSAKDYISGPIIIGLILTLEIAKAVTEVIWLRNNR